MFWSVVRRGAMLVGAGLGLGLAASLVVTRALTSLLHGVDHTDAASFAVAAAILALTALAATVLPACRAVLVEPMSVLRGD